MGEFLAHLAEERGGLAVDADLDELDVAAAPESEEVGQVAVEGSTNITPTHSSQEFGGHVLNGELDADDVIDHHAEQQDLLFRETDVLAEEVVLLWGEIPEGPQGCSTRGVLSVVEPVEHVGPVPEAKRECLRHNRAVCTVYYGE